jgi:hypothetical protein
VIQQNVQPGQRIDKTSLKAQTLNTLFDMARERAASRQTVGRDAFLAGNVLSGPQTVFARNDTGTDRKQFDLMMLGAPVFTPTQTLTSMNTPICLSGQALTLATSNYDFGVLLEPAAAGKIGRVAVAGLCWATVRIIDEHHVFCDVIPGDHSKLLSSQFGRAEIVWAELPADRVTTGVARSLIRMGALASIKCLCEITRWKQISSFARWQYAYSEVHLVGDSFLSVPGGLAGTFVGGANTYALNTLEARNGAQRAGVTGDGVDQAGASYPANFTVRPIGGGTGVGEGVPRNQAVVEITTTIDSTGVVRAVFSDPTSHDGTCS